LLGCGIGAAAHAVLLPPPKPVAVAAAKQGQTVIGPVVTSVGYVRTPEQLYVILSDGRYVVPRSFTVQSNGDYEAQIDANLLVRGHQ
jgi:hypothetical protein